MGSRSPFPATTTIPATHAYELGLGLACPAVSRQEGLAKLVPVYTILIALQRILTNVRKKIF